MDRAFAARWAAALRSGDYPQATGRLKSDMGYCCLGVACDLFAQDGCGTWTPKHAFAVAERDEIQGAALPERVRQEIGLDADDENALIRLNDAGASFDHIAGIVEFLARLV